MRVKSIAKAKSLLIGILLIWSAPAWANNVFGAVNSTINDSQSGRVYILPINYTLVNPSKWLELRPPGIIRLSNQPEIPVQLTKPIGVTLFGDAGSYNLKVSLFFEGNLISHCYKPEVRENVSDNIINITLVNKWNPILFCNNKEPKPFAQIFRVLNANLPGKYVLLVNNQKIADISYSLETNRAEIGYGNQRYFLDGVTQILLFSKPEAESSEAAPTD